MSHSDPLFLKFKILKINDLVDFNQAIFMYKYSNKLRPPSLENIFEMLGRGEEGQPQQFLVRATFSSFSRPSHLGILVLRLFCVKKFAILEDKTIF